MRTETNRYSRYFTYIKPLGKLPIIKSYGSIIFTIIVTAVFLLLAVKPTIETILVLQAKLDEYRSILEKIDQKAIGLSQGKENFDQLSDEIKTKILLAVPDDPHLKTIIDEIDRLAQKHDASISAIQFQPLTIAKRNPAQIGAIDNLNFNVNFEGSYQNIKNLLQDLRISSRVMTIDSVNFNKSSDGNGLVITISAKGFYLK